MSVIRQARHRQPVLIKLLLIFAVVFLTIACSLSFGQESPTLSETDVALAVQSTLNAEIVEDLPITETAAVVNIPITPSPVPLTLPLDTPVSDTPTSPAVEFTPTSTQVVSGPSEIQIKEWDALYWVALSSGCKNNEVKCWKLNDDYKTVNGQADAFLTSEEDVLIEESWPAPYFVFWYKRNLKYTAMISLIVDGKKTDVRVVPTGNIQEWREEVLDLSKYKGANLRFQISCPVGMRYVNSWFINDVRIVTDYQAK